MKAGKIIGYVLLGILFILGVVGVYQHFSAGRGVLGLGSYVVWGLWVSVYIYFIGLSAGAFLLSTLVYVFRVKKLEALGKPSLFVALITLFLALFTILFDLGHMERFYFVFIYPHFHSMMTWMVWMYTAYFLLLVVEFYFAMRQDIVRMVNSGRNGWLRFLTFGYVELSEDSLKRDQRTLRVLGSIGGPLAVAFHGGVGALFGTVIARAYWYTPLVPILFLTGALLSGGALLLFIATNLFKDEEFLPLLGRIVLGLLLFDVLLEFAEFSIPMWYGVGPEFELLKQTLFGQSWWLFWICHILLGFIIPLWLLTRYPQSPSALRYAGFLIALTFFAVRYNIVIPGLVTPELKGLEQVYQDSRLTFSYVPTLHEWFFSFFIVSVGIMLWKIGLHILPIRRLTEEVTS